MAWEELLNIQQEAADDRRAELSTPPESCPNDGEPLEENSAGVLHCPFDGWIWSGIPTDR